MAGTQDQTNSLQELHQKVKYQQRKIARLREEKEEFRAEKDLLRADNYELRQHLSRANKNLLRLETVRPNLDKFDKKFKETFNFIYPTGSTNCIESADSPDTFEIESPAFEKIGSNSSQVVKEFTIEEVRTITTQRVISSTAQRATEQRMDQVTQQTEDAVRLAEPKVTKIPTSHKAHKSNVLDAAKSAEIVKGHDSDRVSIKSEPIDALIRADPKFSKLPFVRLNRMVFVKENDNVFAITRVKSEKDKMGTTEVKIELLPTPPPMANGKKTANDVKKTSTDEGKRASNIYGKKTFDGRKASVADGGKTSPSYAKKLSAAKDKKTSAQDGSKTSSFDPRKSSVADDEKTSSSDKKSAKKQRAESPLIIQNDAKRSRLYRSRLKTPDIKAWDDKRKNLDKRSLSGKSIGRHDFSPSTKKISKRRATVFC